MLENMRTAMLDAGALLDVIQAKLDKYGLEFGDMKTVVDASSSCNDNMVTNLANSLQQIEDAMKLVKLPVTGAEINPMTDWLVADTEFPPNFDEIFGEDHIGIASFAFDGLLALLGALVMLLAFFACFANCRSKCSDSGPGRCIKCLYMFLVLFFGTIVVAFNLAFAAATLGTAVTIADMCSAGPDQVFAGLLVGDGALADRTPDTMGDVTYWTTCKGALPLKDLLDDVDKPLDALANTQQTGFWDTTQDTYADTEPGCPGVGRTPGICAACKSDMKTLGDWVQPGATVYKGGYAISRQTVNEFNELFGCPPDNTFTAPKGRKVPGGGLNGVYSTFVYDALCVDMVAAFTYIWMALAASSFFIVFAFWLLPCTSRDGGGGDDSKDDSKA
jgi:hypothetical protein